MRLAFQEEAPKMRKLLLQCRLEAGPEISTIIRQVY